MATVELESVSLVVEGTHLLRDISLHVKDGELCTFLGPSGCGKTLILRVVAGLTSPTSGEVRIAGRSVRDLAPGKRNVAMVFQTYALFEHMTVWENFAFPLEAARVPEARVAERVLALAKRLYMAEFLDRYPRELSGGQQQRVAIGRAIMSEPSVYLMDEPLGSLDAKLRMELRGALKLLQRERGVTTLYVTHDQADALAIGDRIVVLREGAVQQIGSPEKVYDEPANLFVASFVGIPAMNLFDCRLRQENGSATLRHDAFELVLEGEKARNILSQATNDCVVLGIRPEDVRLSAAKGPGAIPASVYFVEPQSDKLLVGLTLGTETCKARVERDKLGFIPRMDDSLYMLLEPGYVHVFDKSSQARIS